MKHLAIAAALIAGLFITTTPAAVAAHPATRPTVCKSADTLTPNCVWDGRHMGDKKGPSFRTRACWDGSRLVVSHVRISHRKAHRMVKRVRPNQPVTVVLVPCSL